MTLSSAAPARSAPGTGIGRYPPAVAGGLPPESSRADPVLAHGYAVADADRLARRAAQASRWTFPLFAERRDLAWFAIIEHLLTAVDTAAGPPESWDLVRLGENAVTAHVEREGRYRGVYLAQSGVPLGTSMPRFWRYWTSASQPTSSPEAVVIEASALVPIWPRLTRSHQRVLIALAAYDDYQQAATPLGKPYRSFVCTISTARQQFMRLWLQHETPRQTWGRDRRNYDSTRRTRSITVATIRRRDRRRVINAEVTS